MEGEGFGASGSWSLDVGFRVFKWALQKKQLEMSVETKFIPERRTL